MATEQQKQDYLDEHLPYMLKMLRYTYGQILQSQHYLSWNAHFESFAVHARNLANLLTNNDSGNFKAAQFVPRFKARKGDISGPMTKLEQQVFHLHKGRPREAIGKFNTEHAKAVVEWVERNFADFIHELPPALRQVFNEKKSDLAQEQGVVFMSVGYTGPGGPIACTAIDAQTYTASAPPGLDIVTSEGK
jgi:hypothetical protein